jgi:hypothetical protein
MSLLEFETVLTSVHSKGGPNPGAANGADLAAAEEPEPQDLLADSAFPEVGKESAS